MVCGCWTKPTVQKLSPAAFLPAAMLMTAAVCMFLPGGQLTMTGGNIVGCSATGVGGGVSLEGWRSTVDQTTFTMTGGSITGCFAAATDGGGGVNVTGGTFTMAGGSIMECTAHNSDAFSTSYGGGVHIRNGGSFTMSGGTIQNCKSAGNKQLAAACTLGKVNSP